MKKYKLRIGCECSEIIEVEAENEEDAIEQALLKYNCAGNSPLFEEFIND